MPWHDTWTQMKRKKAQPQGQIRQSTRAKRTVRGSTDTTTAVKARKRPPLPE